MLMENKAFAIETKISELEYELKIARLNSRSYDVEVLESEIRDLESELTSLGY